MFQAAVNLGRSGLILFFVSAPLAALGWIAGDAAGAALGAATGACLALGMALATEHVIASHFESVFSPLQSTVEREWQSVLASGPVRGRHAPRVIVFADPAPTAIFARALAGRGTLLLSQGFLATAPASELRSVLALALDRSQRRGALLQAYCAGWIALMLRFAPSGWTRLLIDGRTITIGASGFPAISVTGALFFSCCFAISRFFARMGGAASHDAPLESLHLIPRNPSVRLSL